IEQQRESVLEMMHRLRSDISPRFLKDGITFSFPRGTSLPLSVLIDDASQYRGKAFELEGIVVGVQEHNFNPAERKVFGIPSFFTCQFLVAGKEPVEIITPFVPSIWQKNTPIRESAATIGIFIKQINSTDSGLLFTDAKTKQQSEITDFAHKNSSDVSEETGQIETPKAFETSASKTDVSTNMTESEPTNDELFTKRENIPLFVSPQIRWYPDTFLGHLGFDVGSLELVPALRIADLKNEQLDIPSFLKLQPRSSIIERAFKFSVADWEPFYGLLKAAAATPPGLIEQEARQEQKNVGKEHFSSAELFNDPARTRGKPVLLSGVAKRIIPTLVDDRNVQELYGIDKYFQIYLYTDDSQGNPIVVCVSSLPEGMPVGSNSDFSEQVTIAGFPYKLWIYDSEATDAGKETPKLNYAPLIVGRQPIWHPKPKPKTPESQEKMTFMTTAVLLVCLGIWIVARRFKTSRSIQWKQ
ncbi:MAG: hypothetical protein ACRCUY_07690, partial [Thermoguttaceae bacterium]